MSNHEYWWETLGERERALAEGAISPLIRGGELGTIVWEPELFFLVDAPGSSLGNRAIDLTGNARFLIFGPYINLPPGLWAAKIALGLWVEPADVSFIVEIVTQSQQLTYARLEPAAERIIEVDLSFTIDAVEQLVEIRILSERSASAARIAFGYAALSPHKHTGGWTRGWTRATNIRNAAQ